MRSETMRYAIYYTPGPEHCLAAAAAAWLGRNPHTGEVCSQPALDWLPAADFETLTADPRRYGFHGTLKAPFRLGGDVQETDLIREMEHFASTQAPVMLAAGLKVSRLGPFFALVPAVESFDLAEFASNCVRRFEPFRAPLTQPELTRRRRTRLSDNQDRLLVQWGYPYVFDEFRFHMTLTGRVPETMRDRMLRDLETYFADHTDIPFRLDTLSLFSQASPEKAFRVEAAFPLGDRAAAEMPGAGPEALSQYPTQNTAEKSAQDPAQNVAKT